MDPQQPPTTEPTPASPAPVQTSPITPSSSQMPGSPQRHSHNGVKKLVIAIIAAIVVVGGLVFLLLSPWSPLVGSAPSGPALTVGNNAYNYACPVLDKALVAKQVEVASNADKENTTEIQAYDPANTKDKKEDLAKVVGDEPVTSNCVLKLDRVQSGSGDAQRTSFVNVSLALEQYSSEQKASETFKKDKDHAASPKQLGSFADSFYDVPRAYYKNSPLAIYPEVLHKNMIIRLSAPLGPDDKTGEKNASQLNAVFKDVATRLDHGEALKPKNFNASNQIGKQKFVDSCATVNFAKVATAIGDNTQFNAESVSGDQAYAPDNNKGKTPNQLNSACTLTFRTQNDIDAAAQVLGGNTKPNFTYAQKFPHFITLQIATTASKADAQAYLKYAREQGESNKKKKQGDGDKVSLDDVKMGDGALKVTLLRKTAQSTNTQAAQTTPAEGVQSSYGELFYITKGSHVFVISTTFVEQAKPFATKTKELSTDQIAKIYKEMTLATRRVN